MRFELAEGNGGFGHQSHRSSDRGRLRTFWSQTGSKARSSNEDRRNLLPAERNWVQTLLGQPVGRPYHPVTGKGSRDPSSASAAPVDRAVDAGLRHSAAFQPIAVEEGAIAAGQSVQKAAVVEGMKAGEAQRSDSERIAHGACGSADRSLRRGHSREGRTGGRQHRQEH
jgi:hypothetical protein